MKTVCTLCAAVLLACAGAAAQSSQPDAQAQREAFIQKMIRVGVFAKHEPTSYGVRLTVTQRFLDGAFDDKAKLVAVVYAHSVTADAKRDLVTIYHWRTGKQIGHYSAAGLQIDE